MISPAAPRHTIGSLLESAAQYLRGKGCPSPRLDAELLLARALEVDRVRLYTDFDRPLEEPEVTRFRELVRRRAAREPVAYITGEAHFRRLILKVGPQVLIPRPETEEVVEVALELLRRRPAWPADGTGEVRGGGSVEEPLVVDVGTGSGAIALSLAQEAGVRVLATDISAEALAVARENVSRYGLEHAVSFRQADLLAGLAERSVHLVVSNPPYVASGELPTLAPEIRLFEPAGALDGGPDGLTLLGRVVRDAARVLRPGGSLVVEVGEGQAPAVIDLAAQAGFAHAVVHKDLAGKDRVIEATMPGSLLLGSDVLGDAEVASLRTALAHGAIIGVPTDTVYGIAARWDSKEGISRLFAAKGRAPSQPVAVLFHSPDQIKEVVSDIDRRALQVVEALLPGPYTFLVKTEVPRPDQVGTPDALGVRVPDHPGLLALLERIGVPLAATSANLSGAADVRYAREVEPKVLAHCSVALVLGEGEEAASSVLKVGTACKQSPTKAGVAPNRSLARPSTVVDLRPLARGELPVVVREGAVPRDETLRRIAALGL